MTSRDGGGSGLRAMREAAAFHFPLQGNVDAQRV